MNVTNSTKFPDAKAPPKRSTSEYPSYKKHSPNSDTMRARSRFVLAPHTLHLLLGELVATRVVMCVWANGRWRRRTAASLLVRPAVLLEGRRMCFAFTAFSETRCVEHSESTVADPPTTNKVAFRRNPPTFRFGLALSPRGHTAIVAPMSGVVRTGSFFFLRLRPSSASAEAEALTRAHSHAGPGSGD